MTHQVRLIEMGFVLFPNTGCLIFSPLRKVCTPKLLCQISRSAHTRAMFKYCGKYASKSVFHLWDTQILGSKLSLARVCADSDIFSVMKGMYTKAFVPNLTAGTHPGHVQILWSIRLKISISLVGYPDFILKIIIVPGVCRL